MFVDIYFHENVTKPNFIFQSFSFKLLEKLQI